MNEHRRHLIITWDDETGTVLIDTRGLSPYDVVGILKDALHLAKSERPVPSFLEPEELEDEEEFAGDLADDETEEE